MSTQDRPKRAAAGASKSRAGTAKPTTKAVKASKSKTGQASKAQASKTVPVPSTRASGAAGSSKPRAQGSSQASKAAVQGSPELTDAAASNSAAPAPIRARQRSPATVQPELEPSRTAPAKAVKPAREPRLSTPATVAPPARGARSLDKASVNGHAPAAGTPQIVGVADAGIAIPTQSAAADEDEIWSDEPADGEALVGGVATESRSLAADHERELATATRLTRGSRTDKEREAAAFGSSQSLLSTDYYFRQYGAHGLRSRAAEVDDFGFDPHVDERARPLLEMLCKRYFRVQLTGAENVPEHGRALLVCNRSGALPWDGLVLRTSLRADRPQLAPLRWLSEDSVIHYPFMGVYMNRLGAVRACPENAERLLEQDRLVAVFPEGAQGSRKLFRDRYRLQRFGRGGYVKLALKLGIPILPTAIIGAEETNPVLGRSRLLGRLFGSESLPITPTFPWLGPLGLLPAPVRWRIVVGEPIDLSRYGVGSAEDALVVHRLNEHIRSTLQGLVDHGKRQRGSSLFG